jgi:hypothetical protein
MKNKICTKCEIKKDISEFGKRLDSKCGVKSHCKDCCSLYRKKYYENNKEMTLAVNLKWKHNNTERRRIVNDKWRKKNAEKVSELNKIQVKKTKQRYPNRVKARSIFSLALYRGKIKKGKCEYPNGKCSGRVEGHHWDYNKPLEIAWFCKKHHMLVDKIQKLLPNQYINDIHC